MAPPIIPTFQDLATEATSVDDEARRRMAAARDEAISRIVAGAVQRGQGEGMSRDVALAGIDRKVTPIAGRYDAYFADLPDSMSRYESALRWNNNAGFSMRQEDIRAKLDQQLAENAITEWEKAHRGGGGGGGGRGRGGGGGGGGYMGPATDPMGDFMSWLVGNLDPAAGQPAPVYNAPARPVQPVQRPATAPAVTSRAASLAAAARRAPTSYAPTSWRGPR